jgi:ribosome-associated protein
MNREQLAKEVTFFTARSGGKGGQNVNKVETAVTAIWKPATTQILSEEEKQRVTEKLQNRLNQKGEILVKSQSSRSQLANKQEALKKLEGIIAKACMVKTIRIATKPSLAAKEKRITEKKRHAYIKQNRSNKTSGELY